MEYVIDRRTEARSRAVSTVDDDDDDGLDVESTRERRAIDVEYVVGRRTEARVDGCRRRRRRHAMTRAIDDVVDVEWVSTKSERSNDVRTPARAGEKRRNVDSRTRAEDDVSSERWGEDEDEEDEWVNERAEDDGDERERRARAFDEEFASRSTCVSEEMRRKVSPPATLVLEYWTRDERATEAKRAHIDALDREYGTYGVEEHIERTVLRECDVVLEENMFPYVCAPGVTHRTLWSRQAMDGEAIVRWVSEHLREKFPRVTKWNFDLNENNSVDVPHYHVFTYEPPRCEPVGEEDVDGQAKKRTRRRWDVTERNTR